MMWTRWIKFIVAFVLAFRLLNPMPLALGSTRTAPGTADPDREGVGLNKRKAGERKGKVRRTKSRRHSRLKVTRIKAARNLKPMPPLEESPFTAEVPLLPIIEQAKSMLEQEAVAYRAGSKQRPARREIKLALANFKNGQIRIVSGYEGKQRFTLEDSEIKYKVQWANGFNSSIEIVDPPDTGVVALLYALEPSRQRFFGQDALIYTPFSNALLQPELVEAGKAYLLGKIGQARQELALLESKALPGQSLGNTTLFSDQDYLNLILTEQMDPGRFRSITSSNAEFSDTQERELVRLAERILVIIGANQEDAYSFTGNYASARGIAQFTPMGMQTVWQNYPKAGISRNFLEATKDHVSAIKAEICLLDFYLADLFQAYPGLNGSGFEKYATGACYNGGPKRVHYGLQNFGLDWLHPVSRLRELAQQTRLNRKEQLEYRWLNRYRSHETYVYLNKLHAIEGLQSKLESRGALNPSIDESLGN